MVCPTTMQKINFNIFYSELHKMTNLIKFKDLKMFILRSTHYSFLCSSKYRIFNVDFLYGCGIHHCLHPGFFLNFFKAHNCFFFNF